MFLDLYNLMFQFSCDTKSESNNYLTIHSKYSVVKKKKATNALNSPSVKIEKKKVYRGPMMLCRSG